MLDASLARVVDDLDPATRPADDDGPGSSASQGLRGGDDWTAEDVLADIGWHPPGSLATNATTAVPDPATWLPALTSRSSKAEVCPFLRGVGPGDVVGRPVEAPDVTNRCAALHEPVPQSLRQQELVCLSSGHINCPRYLRGALVASEVTVSRVRARPVLTPAITAALAVLALSFAVSIAFVVANGGLTLPVAAVAGSPSPSGTAVAVAPSHEPVTRPSASQPVAAHTGAGNARAVLRGTHVDAHRDTRTDAKADEDAEAAADVEPLRPAQAVPEQAGLLDLRHPVGRQPVQHRELLRGLARPGQGAQPLDADPEPAGRPPADPADADPLTRGAQSGAATPRRLPLGEPRRSEAVRSGRPSVHRRMRHAGGATDEGASSIGRLATSPASVPVVKPGSFVGLVAR